MTGLFWGFEVVVAVYGYTGAHVERLVTELVNELCKSVIVLFALLFTYS